MSEYNPGLYLPRYLLERMSWKVNWSSWCHGREWQMRRCNNDKYSVLQEKKTRKITWIYFSQCYNRNPSCNLRGHAYEACISIVLLYGFEMWSGKEEEVMHILKNKNMLWWMCCRKCFLPLMTQLCSTLCKIENIFRYNRLKWCGHIFCMEENQWPKQIISFCAGGSLRRKKTF